MFKFLRKTALWIVAVPMLACLIGNGMNQAVLVANHDTFPVMTSPAKLAEYQFRLTKTAATSEDQDEVIEATIRLTELEHGFLDEVHTVMTPETHLNWLADWIDLKWATLSPGDVLQMAGESFLEYAWIIWGVVVIGKLNKKEN